MNKLKCYSYLSKINDKGIPIKEHLEKIVGTDIVPVETIVFINKYYPIDSLKTYEDIYDKRYKNPLYKNLVNEKLSCEDKAVALSSLLTRAMIRMSKMEEKSRKDYATEMNIDKISEALNLYSYNKDSSKLNEVFNNTRSLIKELFNREDEIL